MAGDWIKMRTDLYRDPKVSVIADELMIVDGPLGRYVDQNCQREMTVTRNVMRNVTVGALVSVWGVMRQRGKRQDADLVCDGVSVEVLDDIADLPGFGKAMESAGWVIELPSGLVFPRFFEDYNVDPGASANAERQRRFRQKHNVTHNVTEGVTRNVTVTPREEKRREENKEQKQGAGAPDPLADLPADLARDFRAVRRAKKAPITETAIAGIRREAEKAGLTFEAAVRLCCERGWTAIKADWPEVAAAAKRVPPAQQKGGGRIAL